MDFNAMFTVLKDTTEKYDKKDIENGKVMSVLSYLGILCLLPYLTEKEHQYVRFHAIQGLNLFLIATIYSIAYSVLSFISVVFVFLAVLGIVYALQDKAKEIPVVKKIQIVKNKKILK